MPIPKSIAELNAAQAPLYIPQDVARYLHVPIWFAYTLFGRPPLDYWEWDERYDREPLNQSQIEGDNGQFLRNHVPDRISFYSLVSLFVISAGLRARLSPKLHYLWGIRHFADTQLALRKVLDDPRLLTDPEWALSQFERFYEGVSELDRANLLKWIVLHQARAESHDGVLVRFFPFSRDPALDAPRTVVIDPEIRFGRPTVKGAPTDVLAERWRSGDSAAELAEDYGLRIEEAEEALRYEAIPFRTQFNYPFPRFGW